MTGTVVSRAQTTPSHVKKTLVANTGQTIVDPTKWLAGLRILNWTTAPVYLAPGVAGDPASGAPSDFVPAAAGGVPGQYVCEFAPVAGVRAIGASAGDLTVITW